MKIAIALATAAVLATTGAAAADEPMELTNAQLDRVTAGLLLPAIQAAREATRRERAGAAPVLEVRGDHMLLNFAPIQGLSPPGLPNEQLAE